MCLKTFVKIYWLPVPEFIWRESISKEKTGGGETPEAEYQGRYKICKRKTKITCSECFELKANEEFLRHDQTGRDCFCTHVESVQVRTTAA